MKRTIEEREDMGIKEVNSFYDKEESKLYNYNVNTKPHKTIKHNKNNHKHKLTYRKLINIINKSLNSEI